MNDLKRWKRSVVLAGLAAALGGCFTPYDDFGEAVRQDQELTAVTDPAKVSTAPQDAVRAEKVLERYRADVGVPKKVEQTININVQGGSTGGR